MRCRKIQIMMSASLDNELTDKEKLILEQHISRCSDCAREMEALAGLRLAMSSWKDEEPSERLALSFSYKLRDLTDNKENVLVRRPYALIFGKVAAGFVVMLAIAGLLMQNNTTKPLDVGSGPVSLNTVPTIVADNSQIKQDIPQPVSKSKSQINQIAGHAKRHGTRMYVRAHRHIPMKPVLVAYAPRDDFHTAALASRHAERLILQKMAYARSVDGETAVIVADNLNEANQKMNESIERVRGTLRTAADLMSAEKQTSNGSTSSADGD